MKMEMIKVKKGSFKREGFFVEVSSFKLSKYPVTQKQYKKIMGVTPSYFKGKKHPVESVSWCDAIKFCNELSLKKELKPYYKITEKGVIIKGGKGYRLPTEAEWEYAAKGGSKSNGYEYSGSDNLKEVAWYDKNSGSETHAVGSKSSNELGLYDMSGNVWEWCWDRYDKNYYKDSSKENPQGTSSGSGRVIRGGGWGSYARDCRVAIRYNSSPGIRSGYLGFRVVRSI